MRFGASKTEAGDPCARNQPIAIVLVVSPNLRSVENGSWRCAREAVENKARTSCVDERAYEANRAALLALAALLTCDDACREQKHVASKEDACQRQPCHAPSCRARASLHCAILLLFAQLANWQRSAAAKPVSQRHIHRQARERVGQRTRAVEQQVELTHAHLCRGCRKAEKKVNEQSSCERGPSTIQQLPAARLTRAMTRVKRGRWNRAAKLDRRK